MEDQENPKLTNPIAAIIDGVLALAFFIMMAFILRPFVPMQGPGVVEFWAAFTAIPLAGVFWLVIQMFRVTLTDQLRRRKSQKS
jgi:hypothetical protein